MNIYIFPISAAMFCKLWGKKRFSKKSHHFIIWGDEPEVHAIAGTRGCSGGWVARCSPGIVQKVAP